MAEATLTGSADGGGIRKALPAIQVARSGARETAPPARSAERVVAAGGDLPSARTSSQSRLAFDRELSRVFVEIFDSDSGEVLQRFPPEQIVRYVAELSEASARAFDRERPGLVLDQLI